MSVLCLIAVRNEERYLPGFLHHIRDHVDGIVALDDCSTDSSRDILERESRVVSLLREENAGSAHANEATNRYRLTAEAQRIGAHWVLCADADERFERAFLERLPQHTSHGERTGRYVRYLKLVNLWNSPDHYRSDGLCGPRWAPRMFRMPPTISRRSSGLHRPWFPPELEASATAYMNAYHYHLRMIRRHDRVLRFEKFRTIDPDSVQQSIGYGHLIDEANLKLKPVLPWRGYTDLPRDDEESGSAQRTEPAAELVETLDESAFDELFYLNQYSDVRSAVAAGAFSSGWEHYRRYGSSEGRRWRRRAQLLGLDFRALVGQSRARAS